MREAVLLIIAGLVLLQPGCQNSAPGSRSATPPTPDPSRLAGFPAGQVEAAARLYAIKCAKCHEFYDPGRYPEAEWRSWMDEGKAQTGQHPNIDLALVALRRHLLLPAGAAFGLFALGRSIGWIAHALEQRSDRRLIRPRAIYSGPPPAGKPRPA